MPLSDEAAVLGAEIAAAKALWTYRFPFACDGRDGLVEIRSTFKGLASCLWIDGIAVAADATPPAGPGSTRNHRLETKLDDGRALAVDAGYIDWLRTAIAVHLDGALIHQSHPGKTIALPDRAAKLMENSDPANAQESDIDLSAFGRNKLPIMVDLALGLIFFVVAKFTNLQTAAIAGAGVGIALWFVQRASGKDLLGGLAVFGIVMSLVAAAFAIIFQDDDAVKWRSTVVGLVGAAFFLIDGIAGGRRIGQGMARYLPYRHINARRLALGMGAIGVIMAALNVVALRLLSTDAWLFYTTFVDFFIVALMAMGVMKWARSAPPAGTNDIV